MQLKGQLRMYMRWPLIMTLLLIGMDVWMYMVDKKAGLLMSVIIIIYVGIAFSLYFYNRSSEKRTLSEPYDSRITSGCVSKK